MIAMCSIARQAGCLLDMLNEHDHNQGILQLAKTVWHLQRWQRRTAVQRKVGICKTRMRASTQASSGIL